MSENAILLRVAIWIPLLLSLTVHEWAHAYSAFRLGDDTAARQERLTLNPISHIDPIGTLLLPLLLAIPFGWAKPVPVNPARFSRNIRMRTGMVITAAAGPASNVVLALVCAILLGLLGRFGHNVSPTNAQALEWLLGQGFVINVLLALFNMLPFPPLDGGRVADGLMPARYERAWESFAKYGPAMLLATILVMQSVNLFAWPIRTALGWAHSIATWIAIA